jgi:nucleoside-diphosphate-sugar epimerase
MEFAKLIIIGCGDIGFRVARLALDRGVKVVAVSRGGKSFPDEVKAGLTLATADLDDTETLQALDCRGAALIYSAPPPGGGITDTRVRNFLAAIRPGTEPVKIVYVSASSVYGNSGAELIDESCAPNPANHTGKRRLEAEEQFTFWGKGHHVPVVILRVSGIYGPGRVPLQRILDREPLLCEAEAGYTNRIHADDLAQVCLAALEKGEAGDIFNVCDGESGKMTDYFNAITDLLHLPRLPQVPLAEARQAMSPLMFGYMTDSRRLSNRKMLAKLGIKLQYPTMMAGLPGALPKG